MEKLCICDGWNWLATWQNLELSKNGAFGHAWKACGWCHFMFWGLRRNKMKRGSQELPSRSVLLIDCGCQVTSCFELLLPELPQHDGLHTPEQWAKNNLYPRCFLHQRFYRNQKRSNWDHTKCFLFLPKIINTSVYCSWVPKRWSYKS